MLTPMFMRSACASMASPIAPDCDTKATGPGRGKLRENEAFRRTPAMAFCMPMQFGPIRRMPCRRALATMRASTAAPFGPVSLKPAVITTTPPTRFRAHCARVRGTSSFGTAITARSTRSGMAVTVG